MAPNFKLNHFQRHRKMPAAITMAEKKQGKCQGKPRNQLSQWNNKNNLFAFYLRSPESGSDWVSRVF